MTREQWQRIKAASAAALGLPEGDRQAFISTFSAGDAALEREISSLLAATATAADLFETGALLRRAAAAFLTGTTAPASPHRTLRVDEVSRRLAPGDLLNGRYRVVAVAGHGGMGSVYRVVDLTKERTVALKM